MKLQLPALICALAATTLASAQESFYSRLLKGSVAQPTYAVKDMPENLQAFSLALDSDKTGILGLMALSYAGGAGRSEIMQYIGAYWTDGTEVTDDNGAKYLITYSASGALAKLIPSFSPNGETPQKPDIVLNLVLVKESSVEAITPLPGLNKAQFVKLLKDANSSMNSPWGVDSPSSSGNKAAALSNIKQIALGTIMYENDWDDVMPDAEDSKKAGDLIQPYVKNSALLKSLNPNGGSLRYNTHLAGVNVTEIEAPAEMPLWYDSVAWPDGTHLVAFADGHAKSVSASQWEDAQKLLNKRYKRQPKEKPKKAGAKKK